MESEKAIEKESRFVLRAPTSDVFNMNGLMQLQLWSPSEATCPDVSLFTTSSVFAFLSSCTSYFVAGVFALSFPLCLSLSFYLYFFLFLSFGTTFIPLREQLLPSISRVFPFLYYLSLLCPFRFLASALTFISFRASFTLSQQLFTVATHPRRRHQQTS